MSENTSASGLIAKGTAVGAAVGTAVPVVGTVIGGAIGGAGIWYTFYLQDNKGLYQKQKNNEEIHIFPRRFKLKNMKTR